MIEFEKFFRDIFPLAVGTILIWAALSIGMLVLAQATHANTLHCGKARRALRQAGRPAWGACHRRSTHIIRIRHYCVKLHHHPGWEFWDDNIYDTWRCYK